MTKPLLLLAAVTLCCCIVSLHATPMRTFCRCIQTRSHPIAARTVAKVEIHPISGSCRRTEIIVTRRNGSKVCLTPGVKWVNDWLSTLQNSTNASPTESSFSP